MTLQQQQFIFTENILKLISEAYKRGFKVTFGEAFRPFELHLLYLYGKTVVETPHGFLELEDSKKKAWTKTSKHLKRLAIDFNFFIKNDNSYELTYDQKLLEPLGVFWESLDENNKWGGFWGSAPDVLHFQMSY